MEGVDYACIFCARDDCTENFCHYKRSNPTSSTLFSLKGKAAAAVAASTTQISAPPANADNPDYNLAQPLATLIAVFAISLGPVNESAYTDLYRRIAAIAAHASVRTISQAFPKVTAIKAGVTIPLRRVLAELATDTNEPPVFDSAEPHHFLPRRKFLTKIYHSNVSISMASNSKALTNVISNTILTCVKIYLQSLKPIEKLK